MKSTTLWGAIMALISFTACNAQIKNATTEAVIIAGNCGMCESTIEKAGNAKNAALVDWDKDTKQATLKYDVTKTKRDEILKRIALAGYDNQSFLAPDEAYAKLPACCQYDRLKKTPAKMEDTITSEPHEHNMMEHGHATEMKAEKMVEKPSSASQKSDPLASVFEQYFALKDALVGSDAKMAASHSKALNTAINAVKMSELSQETHMVWMKVMKDMAANSALIGDANDVEKQRQYFIPLSQNMYELIKVNKMKAPVYYQFCPMANDGKGANWLSKENEVKNPYYGDMMLNCGKTVETIQQQ
ncbi:MAG: DUF3347 domain-containing protein [Bacteroidetes bacterium]|nr:DUF3347 domain-containing protein [Bacteroidota bacterium]